MSVRPENLSQFEGLSVGGQEGSNFSRPRLVGTWAAEIDRDDPPVTVVEENTGDGTPTEDPGGLQCRNGLWTIHLRQDSECRAERRVKRHVGVKSRQPLRRAVPWTTPRASGSDSSPPSTGTGVDPSRRVPFPGVDVEETPSRDPGPI